MHLLGAHNSKTVPDRTGKSVSLGRDLNLVLQTHVRTLGSMHYVAPPALTVLERLEGPVASGAVTVALLCPLSPFPLPTKSPVLSTKCKLLHTILRGTNHSEIFTLTYWKLVEEAEGRWCRLLHNYGGNRASWF